MSQTRRYKTSILKHSKWVSILLSEGNQTVQAHLCTTTKYWEKQKILDVS